jgi:hypothetical protein
VDQTIGLLDSLVTLHHDVGSSSADMSSGCEALLAEKAALQARAGGGAGLPPAPEVLLKPRQPQAGTRALRPRLFWIPDPNPLTYLLPSRHPAPTPRPASQEFADALRARLAFFDGYEKAAAEFAAVSQSPGGGALLPLLGRLDEAISYVAANPQYADSITYAAKFRQLQARALGLVRAQVQAALRQASSQVQAAVAEAAAGAAGAAGGAGGAGAGAPGSPSKAAAAVAATLIRQGSAGGRRAPVPLLPEGLEVSLLYVRFRAAAEPGIRGAHTRERNGGPLASFCLAALLGGPAVFAMPLWPAQGLDTPPHPTPPPPLPPAAPRRAPGHRGARRPPRVRPPAGRGARSLLHRAPAARRALRVGAPRDARGCRPAGAAARRRGAAAAHGAARGPAV